MIRVKAVTTTASLFGAGPIDGYMPQSGDLVLVTSQGSHSGVWVVQRDRWVRACVVVDQPTVRVEGGTVWSESEWIEVDGRWVQCAVQHAGESPSSKVGI